VRPVCCTQHTTPWYPSLCSVHRVATAHQSALLDVRLPPALADVLQQELDEEPGLHTGGAGRWQGVLRYDAILLGGMPHNLSQSHAGGQSRTHLRGEVTQPLPLVPDQ
jgi:hypothetical protein